MPNYNATVTRSKADPDVFTFDVDDKRVLEIHRDYIVPLMADDSLELLFCLEPGESADCLIKIHL